jgi:hypothetical protein
MTKDVHGKRLFQTVTRTGSADLQPDKERKREGGGGRGRGRGGGEGAEGTNQSSGQRLSTQRFSRFRDGTRGPRGAWSSWGRRYSADEWFAAFYREGSVEDLGEPEDIGEVEGCKPRGAGQSEIGEHKHCVGQKEDRLSQEQGARRTHTWQVPASQEAQGLVTGLEGAETNAALASRTSRNSRGSHDVLVKGKHGSNPRRRLSSTSAGAHCAAIGGARGGEALVGSREVVTGGVPSFPTQTVRQVVEHVQQAAIGIRVQVLVEESYQGMWGRAMCLRGRVWGRVCARERLREGERKGKKKIGGKGGRQLWNNRDYNFDWFALWLAMLVFAQQCWRRCRKLLTCWRFGAR